MQVRSFYINDRREIERDLDAERLREAREDGTGLLWMDISDPEYESADLLADLGFHALAIDDAMERQHQPAKVDDYNSHLFMVVHGIDYSSTEAFVETARLSIFIASGTVVTLHRVPLVSIDSTIERLERNPEFMDRTSSLFAYSLLDALQESVMPTLEHLGQVADELEEVAIDAPGRQVLQAILQLKRSTIRIQRTIAPQLRVYNRFSRGEFPLVGEQTSVYFRDLYDQMIQLDVINQGVRDTADNALATYLSSIGIKQNETMRVLAIVAAVFLPLSLLAGIYGMNWAYMPELEWRWGYFAVIGVMAAVGLTTFYWLFARHLSLGLRRGRALAYGIKPSLDRVNSLLSPIGTVISATDSAARNITGVKSDSSNQKETK